MLQAVSLLLRRTRPVVAPNKTFATSASIRNKDEIPTIPEGVACCGSGCQNCVWLVYAEKILDYYGNNYTSSNEGIAKALSEIEKLNDENLKTFLRMELRMKMK